MINFVKCFELFQVFFPKTSFGRLYTFSVVELRHTSKHWVKKLVDNHSTIKWQNHYFNLDLSNAVMLYTMVIYVTVRGLQRQIRILFKR